MGISGGSGAGGGGGGGAQNGMGWSICETMKRQNEALAARERSDQARGGGGLAGVSGPLPE